MVVCAVVERVGLWDKLPVVFGRRPSELTVFAPSNEAFDRLPAATRQQLLVNHDNNQPCLNSTHRSYTFNAQSCQNGNVELWGSAPY